MLKSFSIRMCYVIYTPPICLSNPSLRLRLETLWQVDLVLPDVIKGNIVIVRTATRSH